MGVVVLFVVVLDRVGATRKWAWGREGTTLLVVGVSCTTTVKV
jgi:hypothetical protein